MEKDDYRLCPQPCPCFCQVCWLVVEKGDLKWEGPRLLLSIHHSRPFQQPSSTPTPTQHRHPAQLVPSTHPGESSLL